MKVTRRTARRIKRVRAKIVGKSEFPRLSVYRSNRYLYAQVIDDKKHHTLCSISTKSLSGKGKEKITPVAAAKMAGEELAKKLTYLKINQVVFDRGRYKYGGCVQALADGVRSGKITI